MIEAKVIADSIYDGHPRITTMLVKFHRFILPEFNTHRVFSKNTSSSRAISIAKTLTQVEEDPAIPVFWGREQPGMQATKEVSDPVASYYDWLSARDDMVVKARSMADLGVHKQIVNRLIEPWMWTTMVVTATDWDNFFNLRIHEDAQPEIRELAKSMKEALDNSVPSVPEMGWHLPFIKEKVSADNISYLIRKSVACCASTSYRTVDGMEMSEERVERMLHKLMTTPLHASPFEHVAFAQPKKNKDPRMCRNFTKWGQYRAIVENQVNGKL